MVRKLPTLLAIFVAARLLQPEVTTAADIPYIPPEVCDIRSEFCRSLPRARIPVSTAPSTVVDSPDRFQQVPLSLHDAISIALENAAVIRLLSGVEANSSGRTIYDPAISATAIDEQRSRFDPVVQALQSFNRVDQPQAAVNPLDPTDVSANGITSDDYRLDLDVRKQNRFGGTATLGVGANPTRFPTGTRILDRSNASSVELGYTHPLLQGAGRHVNQVPIVLARIDAERSYFQLKESVQELVRGVIDGYWALVLARVDVWVREQQVAQSRFANERIASRFRADLDNAATLAQARLAYENFEATLIASRANALLRETALRNLLGLPVDATSQFVPVTVPSPNWITPDWEALVELAEQNRPDIIELKLILLADQHQLVRATNEAQPQLDALGLYRWNGLEGELPSGAAFRTDGGRFHDWTLGINFSVPVGLRQARAGLRRVELLLARDQQNLDQGMHRAVHRLAIVLRNQAQLQQQYERFRRVRDAALYNLNAQTKNFQAERISYINVLQAITDWGNAVNSEAQSLLQYHTELANLERETGTILESHGVYFYEERYRSVGPVRTCRRYPRAMRPAGAIPRHDVHDGLQPSEAMFQQQVRQKPEAIPAPLPPRLPELSTP